MNLCRQGLSMDLWMLLLLLCAIGCKSESCDLSKLPDTCDADLPSGDTVRLNAEANRTAHCILNFPQHQLQEPLFKCLLHHIDHLLPEQEQHFGDAPEHVCVLCQVVQLYNCEKTLTHAQCGERFIGQLTNIQRNMKRLGIPQEGVNSWVKRFLDVKNWDFYRFRGVTSTPAKNVTPSSIRPAYVYGREEGHYMDKLKDKMKALFVSFGGIPGLVIVKALYVACLVLNCLLIKILVFHKDMRSHAVILNLVVGDLLNLIFDNFIAVFLITHWYPSATTISTLVYFNYAIVALQVYTVIMYGIQRKFASLFQGFMARHASWIVSMVLWLIAALVPAPICLMTLSAKNGILYSFISYVLIPVICIILCSKEKRLESGGTMSHCQACSQNSSMEKMCHSHSCQHSHPDRTQQTERWVQNNPAETSFDSEINSGDTILNSDNERHDSLAESALNLQRTSQPCVTDMISRSQGARFQKALVSVYVMTYVPAICLYLALYFAIKREEFIYYRRLFVHVYAMLNPIAMYLADKTLKRYIRSSFCCCCNQFKRRRAAKLTLG